MKRIIIALMLTAIAAFAAKPVTVEICQPSFCYEMTYADVAKTEFLTDATGKKFLRIHFMYGKILDISGYEIKLKRR